MEKRKTGGKGTAETAPEGRKTRKRGKGDGMLRRLRNALRRTRKAAVENFKEAPFTFSVVVAFVLAALAYGGWCLTIVAKVCISSITQEDPGVEGWEIVLVGATVFGLLSSIGDFESGDKK